MYQTLALNEFGGENQRIFAIAKNDAGIERFKGYKTSKRTLVICSLVLIATSGILATWLFFAKPHFHPTKVRVTARDLPELSHEDDADSLSTDLLEKINFKKNFHSRMRRDVSFSNSTALKNKVEILLNPKMFPINDSRLPFSLVPEEYFLTVEVDLEKKNFSGEVKITLTCDRKTDKVIFHGRNLDVLSVNVTLEKVPVAIRRKVFIKKFEMFVIELDGSLEEGKLYEVTIVYNAKYSKSLAGLYKSHYKNEGEKQTMVSTHFEPTDARSMFPCLDEPFFKAKFHISVVHDKNLTALSNMPLAKTVERGNNRVESQFQTSVKMSTYLVALSVNGFDYYEQKTKNGVKVRTYAQPSDKSRIKYATDAGARIISYYEDFFGAKYPLPKLDLLAVPDFLAGAMEDWGLVSFRTAYLIYDRQLMTAESMRQITLVIAHELAHQWFGNLVTMKWWNDIWLNEGFANFVEMLGTNVVNPEFRALDIQVPTGWQAAITMDSLKNSHPVSQDVQEPSEIDELFDSISYNKGASLLRMVEGFMGDGFMKAVKTYIQEYKFSNAETDDLWRHLSKAYLDKYKFETQDINDLINHMSKEKEVLDMKSVMDTWTKQRGFPLITLKRVNETKISVTQESFLAVKARIMNNNDTSEKRTVVKDAKEKAKWYVPFTYMTSDNPEKENLVWMKNQKEIFIDVEKDLKYIKANLNSRGFYMVNYDNTTWWNLIRQLRKNHTVFSDINRAGILHDAFKLACEGVVDPIIPLEMSKYLTKEKDYIPWAMVRAKYDCISMMIKNKTEKMKYKKFMWHVQAHLVNAAMLNISSNAEDQNLTMFDKFQRFEAFSFALKNGFRNDYKKQLRTIFLKMRNRVSISNVLPEMRALALMYGYDTKDDADWNYLWQLYVDAEVDSDRKLLMKAFSQFKDKDKINKILENSMDENMMRIQDTIPMLANIVRVHARKETWEFVVKNYKRFRERYGGGYQFGQLMSEVAGGFSSPEALKEVKAFFKKHPIGKKNSMTEKQILEKIQNNVHKHTSQDSQMHTQVIGAWVDKELDKIKKKKQL